MGLGILGSLIGQGLNAAIKGAVASMPEKLLKAADNDVFEDAVEEVAKVVKAMDDKPVLEKRVALTGELQRIADEHDLDDLATAALEGVLHNVLGLHIEL